MKELLKKLVETPGVSGSESKIRETIKEEIEEDADSTEVDNMGNLIARKGDGEKTLMLTVHMDQIGLTVKRIDEEGFIKFSKVGGVTTQSLMNQRVEIHTDEGTVAGVIGMKPPHLMDKEERDKLPEKDSLFIDIGAEDDEAVEEAGVNVGNYITFERESRELLGDYLTSMAMDNRVGCLVGIESLKRFEENYELAVVFSTQEEVGLKGAKTSAYKIDPDAALAIDVSIAGDSPGIEPQESDLEIGEGVEITMMQSEGRGLITPESIREWLLTTAEENKHDHQRGVWEGGATDAAKINLVKEGIPTGSLGVPLRNMHSATEVVKISDIEDTVEFVEDTFRTFEDHF
ncbi:MAG: putative aminopeptidase FrvX [Candidatus Nanohaloarchaea archaeon]|jgi:putative aminopeptidase FrvX